MHISQESLDRAIERLRAQQADSDVSLHETIAQLTDSAFQMFGLTGAGLMLLDEGQLLHSVLATDDLGWSLEHAQEQVGTGPCVDTLVYGHPVSTTNVRDDERWPALAGELAGSSIGGVLGVPVTLSGTTVGALDVYVDHTYHWDDSDERALSTYSTILETVLGAALLAERQETLATQLQHALDSRVMIERCVGLLMGREGIDAVTAFNRLRDEARASRRKVHDLASEILGQHP